VIFPLVAHTFAFSKPPGWLKLAGLTVLACAWFPLVIVLLNACDKIRWPMDDDSFWDNSAMIFHNPLMLWPFMALCAAATADVMSDDGLLRNPLLRAALLLLCVVWFFLEVFVWKDKFSYNMAIWAFPVAAITMPFLLQPSVVFSERGTEALLEGVVGRTLLWLAPYSTGFYAWQVTRLLMRRRRGRPFAVLTDPHGYALHSIWQGIVLEADVKVLFTPIFRAVSVQFIVPTPIIVFLKFVLMGAISYVSCHVLERPGNALLLRLIGSAQLAK
jgi:hypothetical protein